MTSDDVTNLYAIGRAYLQATQLLAGDPQYAQRGHLAAPAYMLIGFALELFLKAYLANAGVDNVTLETKLGHNLKRAYKLALERGYVPCDDLLARVIKLMHPIHLKHQLRYMPANHELIVPELSQSLAVLVRFDREVRSALGHEPSA